MIEIQVTASNQKSKVIQVPPQARIGRSAKMDIQVQDPTIADHALDLTIKNQSYPGQILIQSRDSSSFWKAHDLKLQVGLLPLHTPFYLGKTQLQVLSPITSPSLPPFPAKGPRWETRSHAGREVLKQTWKAAQTPLSIFICGETGTGKEILAHSIHLWSKRKDGPIVPINCAALPPNLVDTELFGHLKGAFTGAIRARTGALMQAHRGTLFLDEVGDLPLDIQAKLLRFLENGEVRAVGSDRINHADVRIVCATHKPLLQLVKEGKFRQDLYYRLASVTLQVPPLRERRRDIDYLAQHFVKRRNRYISRPAVQMLRSLRWPGNVRELQNTIERAAGFSTEGATLTQADFSFLDTRESQLDLTNPIDPPVLKIKDMEKLLIRSALKQTHGNRKEAASLLGIGRSTLFEKIKVHAL